MKNRLMILALAVTVLATVLLGCAKQEENPTTEPDTIVSETTTQEETTAKSPGEALSEGASEAGSKVREGATDLSEAASRAGETVSRRRRRVSGSLGVIIRKIRFRQYPGCCGFGGLPSARPGNSNPGAAAQFSSYRSPCPCKCASSCRLAS